jgi:hypothetical protein
MFRFNHHHQEAHDLSLLKLHVLQQTIKNSQLKYIVVVNLVVWLHIPYTCIIRSFLL